jgi:hypothetical protein
MNQSAFASALMEKCQMNCGDFIDIITTWEKMQQKDRQIQDLNSKKAGSLSDSDVYRTPTSNGGRNGCGF